MKLDDLNPKYKPRVPQHGAQQAEPTFAPTGCVPLDTCADVVNRTTEPFKTGPPPDQGTLGAINHYVSASLALVGVPFELLDTGFAVVTADVAALMPGMPAATLGGLASDVVPHGHLHPPSLVPPATVPVPIPAIGATAASGCVSVLIGYLPALRAGDMGLSPTCGGLAPIFDIWTGSSNTFIGGSRAARALDVTRHCSSAAKLDPLGAAMGAAGVYAGALGAAAGAAAGQAIGAALGAAQAAADTAALAMSALMGTDPAVPPIGSLGAVLDADMTVLIGGFPIPDVLELPGLAAKAVKGALKLVGKLGKKLSNFDSTPKRQNADCQRPGEPVDPVTGASQKAFVDFAAPPPGILRWERHYDSSRCDADGPLGFGHRHGYQYELFLEADGARFVDPKGAEYVFPVLGLGTPHGGNVAGRVLVEESPTRFTLRVGPRRVRFLRDDARAKQARAVRFETEGGSVDYRYDGGYLSELVEETPHGEHRVELVRDAAGHVASVIRRSRDGGGVAIARYGYDAAGCLSVFEDALGARASYAYDEGRRMVERRDRNGYAFRMRYDADGRCVEEAGQDGLWRCQLRYEEGKTLVTESDGSLFTYRYDENGTIRGIADPTGAELLRVVDRRGLVVREIDSGGRATEWLYDIDGYHLGRRDRWGNLLPPIDVLPNPPDPLAHRVPATHWAQQYGGLLDALRPTGLVAVLPDPVQRAAAATLRAAPVPAGDPTPSFDAAGRVIVELHAAGITRRFERDAEGNVVALVDGDGRARRRSITSWNLVAAETDELGHTTRVEHTLHEQVAAIVDAGGSRSDYRYDHRDRLVEVRRHGAVRERYEFDRGDRLVRKYDGAGKLLLSGTVGKNGLHKSLVLASGERYRFAYDRWGQPTEASSLTARVELRHDAARRRLLDKRGGRGIEHVYERGRLRRSVAFDRFVVAYHDEPDGSVRIETPDGGTHRIARDTSGAVLVRLASGTSVLSSYGPGGRCEGRVVWRTGRSRSLRWAYSAEGELREALDSERGATKFAYDAAHRLVAARSLARELGYAYDPAGNLTSTPHHRQIGYREGNRLAHADGERFEFDGRNHLARRLEPGGREVRYGYDGLDQLVRVAWSDRAEAWTAAYDGLGRRTHKALGGARTEFYWDGDRLAAEVSPEGRLRLYLYPSDEALLPFAFLDYASLDADPSRGSTYYVFHDQSGLPLFVEDEAGRVAWSAASVDPYGALVVAPGATTTYDLRWPGHYFDRETGLHDNRFRSYDPALGRYLQSDPAGQSGGVNLYAYASNPLAMVDVLGLAHESKPKLPETPRRPLTERLADILLPWRWAGAKEGFSVDADASPPKLAPPMLDPKRPDLGYVSPKDVTATQPQVFRDTTNKYKSLVAACVEGGGPVPDALLPEVFDRNGTKYFNEGHHRAQAWAELYPGQDIPVRWISDPVPDMQPISHGPFDRLTVNDTPRPVR